MKIKKKINRAFSLMEISVVILLIGILVFGITYGTEVIERSRIRSAQTLTASSPVRLIPNLALWLETTSETSFPNSDSLNDKTAVSIWYDINPQESIKSNATQSTSTYQPIYYKNSINGLPSLKFDGSDDIISSDEPYLKSGFPAIFNNFSVFVVALPTTTTTVITESNSLSDQQGSSGQKYVLGAKHGDSFYSSISGSSGIGISFGTNTIQFFEHSNAYMPGVLSYTVTNNKPAVIEMKMLDKTTTLYLNGTFAKTGLTSLKNYVFPPHQFGGGLWGYFQGYIGEIIVFSRTLDDDEREAVNSYLKEKWNIS